MHACACACQRPLIMRKVHSWVVLLSYQCVATHVAKRGQRIRAASCSWQFPSFPESQRPASKRRKRKGSTSGPGNNAPPAPSKKRSPGPNFSLASQVNLLIRFLNEAAHHRLCNVVNKKVLTKCFFYFDLGCDGRGWAFFNGWRIRGRGWAVNHKVGKYAIWCRK